MAVGALFTLPWVSPLDAGAVVPGSKLTFSLTGTSTLANTYSDSALTTPNANPVVADAEGVAGPIYLDPTIVYRVTWATSADVQIRQQDDIVAGQTVSASYRLIDTAPTFYLEETDAAANNGKWRVRVNGEQLSIDVGNDAESSWVQAITIDRTANTVDTVNIKSAALQLNGVPLIATGSFTGALTGYAASLTPTIQWRRSGNVVTLSCNSGSTGTSTTAAMTLTGMPASIYPTTSEAWLTRLTDNGTVGHGIASVGTSGTITFGNGIAGSTFTASGTKGLPGNWTLMYELQL